MPWTATSWCSRPAGRRCAPPTAAASSRWTGRTWSCDCPAALVVSPPVAGRAVLPTSEPPTLRPRSCGVAVGAQVQQRCHLSEDCGDDVPAAMTLRLVGCFFGRGHYYARWGSVLRQHLRRMPRAAL